MNVLTRTHFIMMLLPEARTRFQAAKKLEYNCWPEPKNRKKAYVRQQMNQKLLTQPSQRDLDAAI